MNDPLKSFLLILQQIFSSIFKQKEAVIDFCRDPSLTSFRHIFKKLVPHPSYLR
jgi:hypothetical protein